MLLALTSAATLKEPPTTSTGEPLRGQLTIAFTVPLTPLGEATQLRPHWAKADWASSAIVRRGQSIRGSMAGSFEGVVAPRGAQSRGRPGHGKGLGNPGLRRLSPGVACSARAAREDPEE